MVFLGTCGLLGRIYTYRLCLHRLTAQVKAHAAPWHICPQANEDAAANDDDAVVKKARRESLPEELAKKLLGIIQVKRVGVGGLNGRIKGTKD